LKINKITKENQSIGGSVVELDDIDGEYQNDPSLIEKEILAKLKPYLID